MEEMIPGGWGNWSDLTDEAKEVFDATVGHLHGVNYDPVAFSSQVVSGKNYCYICKGTIVYKEPTIIIVLIYVYKPINDPAYITEIKRIYP